MKPTESQLKRRIRRRRRSRRRRRRRRRRGGGGGEEEEEEEGEEEVKQVREARRESGKQLRPRDVLLSRKTAPTVPRVITRELDPRRLFLVLPLGDETTFNCPSHRYAT